MNGLTLKKIQQPEPVILAALAVFAVLFTAALSIVLPAEGIGVDWYNVFHPVLEQLLRFGSPYEVEGYYNAPWALLPLLPLGLLPARLGYAAFIVISLIATGYVALRMGATPLTLGLLLISPPMLHGLVNGNLDWIPLLGIVMPPQIGLFFLAVKPQVGFGLAVFWTIHIWRTEGFRTMLSTIAPISVALAISFLVFGLWPLQFETQIELWWNASLWPLSLPIGLLLLTLAIKHKDGRFAIPSSPFLSPYVLLHSYIGTLVPLVRFPLEMAVVVGGLWAAVLIQAFTS